MCSSLTQCLIHPKVMIEPKCWLCLAYFFQIENSEYHPAFSTHRCRSNSSKSFTQLLFLKLFDDYFSENILTKTLTFILKVFHISRHHHSPIWRNELIYWKQYYMYIISGWPGGHAIFVCKTIIHPTNTLHYTTQPYNHFHKLGWGEL